MIKTIILGIFQGLTEFLPISSSGHLVILKHIFNYEENGITLEIFLHFGTLISIIVFFNKKILNYLKLKNLILIIIGSIPAGLLGIFFKDYIEYFFNSIFLVTITLILTGLYLLLADKRVKEKDKDINIFTALIIGLAQGFALLPGITRSGWTTSTGILLGIKRITAFEFSFILSIPAIIGALILELKDVGLIQNIPQIITGTFFSFLSGLIALFLFSKIILLKKLRYFSYYLFFISFLLFAYLTLAQAIR